MKRVLSTAMRFLLVFLAALALWAMVRAWVLVAQSQFALPPVPAPAIAFAFVHAVADSLVPALLSAVAVVLVGLRRTPQRAAATAVVGVLAFGVMFFGQFAAEAMVRFTELAPGAFSPGIQPELLYRGERGGLMVGNAGVRVGSALVATPADQRVFAVHHDGVLDREAGRVLFPTEALTIELADFGARTVSHLRVPAGIEAWSADIAAVTRDLRRFFPLWSVAYLVSVLAVVTAAMGSSAILRITGWPLFNVFATLAYFRGLFYLYRVMAGEWFQTVVAAVFQPTVYPWLPSGGMLAVGVVLLVADGLVRERPQ